MSSNQKDSDQEAMSSQAASSASGRESSRSKSDEWSEVKDPNQRRKIQNKLAQRRFRKSLTEEDNTLLTNIQETKFENKRKKPNVMWRIHDGREAPTPLRSPVISIRTENCPVCRGEAFR